MSSKRKCNNNKKSSSGGNHSTGAASGSRESLTDIAADMHSILQRSEEISGEPDDRIIKMMKEFQDLHATLEEDGDDLTSSKLARDVKEMASVLKEYENCGSSDEEEADFISGMAQKIAAIKPPSESVKEGTVAMVHSLQSAGGKKTNGSRVLVMRHHPEQDRWQVRVEFQDGNVTKALKGANLTPLRRLPLPTGFRRGFADINNFDTIVPQLCELLLYHKGAGPGYSGDFSPSDIIFTGYASMALQRMGESNFMCFVATQLEQMGGVLGLGNLCREAEEPGTEAAVFGLLEGDKMYIDVLIQTMHWTGEIIEEDDNGGEIYMGRSGFNGPPTQLTPDQDTAPYVRTMEEGPVLILECVAKYSFAPALWAALADSEFFHLLIQRLMRWMAREVKKTRDGKGLGGKARMILSSMFPEFATTLKQPISAEAADEILSESSTLFSEPSSVTLANLEYLLDSES